MYKFFARRSSGFTLIEVLIVLAIIAILTVVAIPNYTAYVNKGKTATGQEAISNVTLSLEQAYQDYRSYPASQAITDSQNYFTYTYTQAGTPVGQAYYILANGNGTLANYFIAANSADVRCVCLDCGSNPFTSFNDSTTTCPAGSTAY